MNESETIHPIRLLFRRPALLLTGVLITALAVTAQLYQPVLVKDIVDGAVSGAITRTEWIHLVSVFLGLVLVGYVLGFGMRFLPQRLALKVEQELRKKVFAHLALQDQDFFYAQRTGDLMTRMTSDLTMVREALGQGLLHGVRITLALTVAFSIMIRVSPALSLVMAIIFPCMAGSTFLFMRAIRRRHERQQKALSQISNQIQESLTGIRTVKSFAMEERRFGLFEEASRSFARKAFSLARVEQGIWPLMALWFSGGTAALLWIGGRQIVRGELTLGELVQFNQYLLYLQWPMVALGWVSGLAQRGLTSWKRIRSILETQPSVCDGPQTDANLTNFEGHIVFEHVTVRREGRALVEDLSFSVPAKTTLGLTGPTGSGKTVCVALLARILDPDEGRILLDGRDLREYPLDVLRGHVGLAPQEPVLFSDSLAGNLAFGLEEENMEDVVWASKTAHLHDEVADFPEQYQTVLGERGVTLSGGQRQRTAIGRALARRPAILLLDDVLASVDTQTESALLNTLQPLLKECTGVITSHRVSALKNCQQVLVLEAGRMTQLGTPEVLTGLPGYYREAFERQQVESSLEALL